MTIHDLDPLPFTRLLDCVQPSLFATILQASKGFYSGVPRLSETLRVKPYSLADLPEIGQQIKARIGNEIQAREEAERLCRMYSKRGQLGNIAPKLQVPPPIRNPDEGVLPRLSKVTAK